MESTTMKHGQLLVLERMGYYATYICEEYNNTIRVFLERTLDKTEGELSGMYLICGKEDILIIK
jgi:hypothetical protein